MRINELDNLPETDDIVLQVEQLKMGLIARATGEHFEEKDYSRLRKMILGLSNIEKIIPRFLKLCRTLDEFWGWIRGVAGTYAERRVIIGEALNPILEVLENEVEKGYLEFQNNYEEKEIIGSGGFGQVYLVEHRLLNLPFAVKIFAPAFYKGGEKELERFFQEARMLFQLNHPSIIKVYDAGMIKNRPFLRMEYFAGRNLNQVLSEYGFLNPKAAITMMENLVSAMEHAHETVKIIHRDLKPSNIMAAKPKKFKIIDFGLGIFLENQLHSRLTKTGEAAISGYYNAPELVANPKLVDKRSDIYSLGAIWYTMLTGLPPAGTSFLDKLNDIDGIDNEYKDCVGNCLTDIEKRTPDCPTLLEQIKKLK